MKKNVFGRRFKRDKNERKALFKGLLSSLVLIEKIKTTEQKAKAIKGQADKLVTLVKHRGDNAYTLLQQHLTPEAIVKLQKEIAPRFAKRSGGYTSLVRLGHRQKDRASMVLLEWVEEHAAAITPQEKNEKPKELVVKSQKQKREIPKKASARRKQIVKKETVK